MKVAVRWSDAAIEDLHQIYDWTKQTRTGSAAKQILRRLRARANILRKMPDSGRPGQVAGTRELIEPPFVIAYRVDPPTANVEILRVLHGARQWPGEL
ncbi:MAG: type II toxin-antitoxin system RelE/ParE family toxin [Alphaproteobacteria bacterium]